MSEEQQTAVQQSEAAQAPAPVAESTAPAAEETEAAEQESPAETKVFGMSRSRFHAAALGIAAGFIVSGLAGILFHVELNPTTSVIVCGAIGFGISYLIDRKREKDAAQNGR